jgi:hypothetical protein
LVIYVVDYTGCNVVSSYNRSVNISSSDSEVLSVPKKAKLKNGSKEIGCTIGMKEGTAKIKISGSYLESNSFRITAENNAAKLASVKAVDLNDKSRFSETNLQMVGKTYASRRARVYAYKDEESREWEDGEPVWTGRMKDKDKGIDKIDVSVRGTYVQTASAGGISKSVTLEIVDGKEYEIKAGASFKKLQDILNSASSKLGGKKDTIKSNIHAGCKWYKVDQKSSPLCKNTYEFSGGGDISFDKKIYPPCLSFNFPFVKVGGFVEPNITLDVAGVKIIKDGSSNPTRFTTVEGGATLSGSLSAGIGAEIEDPLEILSLEADLKGTVGASGSFSVSAPGPILKGDYEIGTLKASGMVKIAYRDNTFIDEEITKTFGDERGLIYGQGIVDFSDYFKDE